MSIVAAALVVVMLAGLANQAFADEGKRLFEE